jgi:hypothetical protein
MNLLVLKIKVLPGMIALKKCQLGNDVAIENKNEIDASASKSSTQSSGKFLRPTRYFQNNDTGSGSYDSKRFVYYFSCYKL